MGRRSFEVGDECICGLAEFADCCEPLSNRPGLPVAIGLGVLLLKIGNATDGLIHWILSD
jgi:hypothetical protein